MVKQIYWNGSVTIQKGKLKFITHSIRWKWPRPGNSGREHETSIKRDYFMLSATGMISENLLGIVKYAHSFFIDKS